MNLLIYFGILLIICSQNVDLFPAVASKRFPEAKIVMPTVETRKQFWKKVEAVYVADFMWKKHIAEDNKTSGEATRTADDFLKEVETEMRLVKDDYSGMTIEMARKAMGGKFSSIDRKAVSELAREVITNDFENELERIKFADRSTRLAAAEWWREFAKGVIAMGREYPQMGRL